MACSRGRRRDGILLVRWLLRRHGWKLLDPCDCRRVPSAGERIRFGGVEAHSQIEGPLRRGKPVGLLVLARVLVLEIEVERTVGVGPHQASSGRTSIASLRLRGSARRHDPRGLPTESERNENSLDDHVCSRNGSRASIGRIRRRTGPGPAANRCRRDFFDLRRLTAPPA